MKPKNFKESVSIFDIQQVIRRVEQILSKKIYRSLLNFQVRSSQTEAQRNQCESGIYFFLNRLNPTEKLKSQN